MLKKMLTLVIAAVPLCLVSNMSVAQDSGNSGSTKQTLIIQCSALSNPPPVIRSNDSGTNPEMKFGFGQVSDEGISFKNVSNSIFKDGTLSKGLILAFNCSKKGTHYDLDFLLTNCKDFTCPCPSKANCSSQKN